MFIRLEIFSVFLSTECLHKSKSTKIGKTTSRVFTSLKFSFEIDASHRIGFTPQSCYFVFSVQVLRLEQELALSEGRYTALQLRLDQFEGKYRPRSQTTDGRIFPTGSFSETRIQKLFEQIRELKSQVPKHENRRDNESSVYKVCKIAEKFL